MDLELNLDELVNLRHRLHANAEVSNQEEKTARIIIEFLKEYNADHIWEDVGGHGVIALFKGEQEGKSIGFRADLDALHIEETIHLEYESKTPHTSHKCGHDGHMAMVAGIASYLKQNSLKRGNVYLIFQPAEETGEGAERIDKSLKDLEIDLDYLFGLHNLPGFPKGEILTKKGTFAAASRGMVVKIFGKTSHAAEPEHGISPVIAIAKISTEMTYIHRSFSFSDLTLATVVHSELGEIAFGTSPGYGEVRITLRAMKDDDMTILIDEAENLVHRYCQADGLGCEISYTEIFPSTVNTEEAFNIMQKAATSANLDFNQMKNPFKWSEDFGQYSYHSKTGFFGIGAGEDRPHLHNEFYDFPDAIIEPGIQMYVGLMKYFGLIE